MLKKKQNARTNERLKKPIRLPQVIGAMKASKAAEKLDAAGDKKTAERLRALVAGEGKDIKLASIFRF